MFELSPILEPLAPYRNQMLVLSGLYASWNYIHAGASGSFLTGTPRGGRNEIEILADISIDQILAQHFGKQTQLASLELSMDAPANAGACTGNLSCVYTHTLSWRRPTQPLPMEYNPRAVFETVVSATAAAPSAAAREARMRQHKSILDSVTERLADLRRELGPQDQAKVDEYTEVGSRRRAPHSDGRSAERRRAAVDGQPQGAPPVFEDHLALMLDLQLLAFQSDLTRVISFMLGKEQSARPYPQIGVPEAHHPLSHHNDVPELVAQHVEDQPLSRGAVLEVSGEAPRDARRRRLAAGPHDDPVRLGDFEQQRSHSGDNLPLLLRGRRSRDAQGRPASALPDKPSMANLLVTMMDKFDVPVEKIGGSTGKLLDTLSGI